MVFKKSNGILNIVRILGKNFRGLFLLFVVGNGSSSVLLGLKFRSLDVNVSEIETIIGNFLYLDCIFWSLYFLCSI